MSLSPETGILWERACSRQQSAHADGLKLNITDADNALDLELALEVVGYFRVSQPDAQDIIAQFKEVVSQWPVLAGALRLSRREQNDMAPAFHLSDK
ncbi:MULTISPECIES: hypothetical protein [Pseudomonas]|uniref:hypothetical protein n=1 Tax=Pseudomonas TaxID=286 RepID=UPI003EBA00E3